MQNAAAGTVFLKRKQAEVFSRLRFRPAVLGAMILAACTPQSQDQIARDAARATITPLVAQRFPTIPVDLALDCLIGNASAEQINALAADSLLGATESSAQIMTEIAAQPQTLTCLAASGAPGPLR